MYTSNLALALFVLGSSATPAHSFFPRGDNSTGNSNSTGTNPTAAHVTGTPQVTPDVPASEVVTGRYTLAPVPSQCTGSFVPYQTTFWAKQNQMNLQDATRPSWFAPKDPVDWTFSTNTSDVFFSEPDWIAAGLNPNLNLKPRTKKNSFTLTMDDTDGNTQTLFWEIFRDNGTVISPNIWNVSLKDMPVMPSYEDVTYQLTISGKLPCEHPIGNNTCASNKIELTPDAWKTYGVDDFFKQWYDNRSSTFADDGGMMQVFGKDFKVGSAHTCTIDNACNLLSSCSDLADHGKDANSAQIFLVWQALQNISDMLNRMYNNLNIAQGDTMTKIAQIALEFYTPIVADTPPPNPLLMSSGILGMLSAFGGLVPVAGPSLGATLGAASGLAGVINSQKATAPPDPDPQFAKTDADLGVVFGNYTKSMRTQLQNIHTSIFERGDNVTDLLEGGTYVDRTVLNVDCDDCIPKAQAWLEQMLTLKMINYMWIQQNVFVTYMPYGKIIQLDTLEQTDFTIDSCYSDFKTRDDEKNLVACMDNGMARLTYYNPANSSNTKPDDDGSVNLNGMPPGADGDKSYNSTEAVSVNFDPSHAASSSAAGYLAGGLGYDALGSLTDNILSGGQLGDVGDPLQQLWNVNATTAGMFALPVCIVRDLNYWPTFYGQGKDRRNYNDYCICYNDLNSNPDKGVFSEFVTGNFSSFVTTYPNGGTCDKGYGTEPGIAGSPVGLAPRGTRNDDYEPLPWP